MEANQPEQDACNAIALCGKAFTSTYSYQGIGQQADIAATPCGSRETNSVWLKVVVKTPGMIAFRIRPIDALDDYDFAVVKNNENCTGFSESQVIRCNFNNNQSGSNADGIVGLSPYSNEPYIQSGIFGHSFAQAIDAGSGDVFYIMINNFGHETATGYAPSAGFTVDFSESTATFENTSIPSLGTVVPACDYSKSISISLTNYARCGSIAADGSDFVLRSSDGTQYPIQSANGVNCSGADGYTREINLQFGERLPNGNYTIQARKGSDGNTVLGLCDGEMLESDPPVAFTVWHDTLRLVTLDSPACKNLHLIFNQTVDCRSIDPTGNQFYLTGPATITIDNAAPLSACIQDGTTGISLTLAHSITVDGTYILHFRKGKPLYGTCGNILDEDIAQPFTIQSFNGLVRIMPDTTVCRPGDSIQLSTINLAPAPATGFDYTWTDEANEQLDSHVLSPWATIDAQRKHFLLETYDLNGCLLRDTVNIAVENYSETLSPSQAAICLNDSLLLSASPNAIQYQWYEDALLERNASRNLSSTATRQTMFHPDSVGIFTYYLLMTSRKQCLDTLSAVIEVKPLPNLQLAFNDTTINYGTDLRLGASGADRYEWVPMQWLNNVTIPEPITHPLRNILYTVKGSIANGCYTTDSVYVKIYFEDFAFFPSGFTPNQDGKNDLFRPTFFGKINNYKLRVFNRWGQLVFQSENPSSGWDGKAGTKTAEGGTYIWECHYQPEGEKAYHKKGTVVLVR